MNKIFTSKLNLKNEATGTVEAVFALLNTPDSDRDVTLPNAFGRQSVILEPWAHNYSGLPVGKGKIFEQGEEAVFSGQFFMDNQSGREHYQALKALGELTQWSYSFQVIKSHPGIWTDGSKVQFLDRLDVFGVSPVVRGAQSSTYTRSIKGEKRTWMPIVRSALTVKSARRTIETTLDELLGDELHDIEARVAAHPEHPQGLLGMWCSALSDHSPVYVQTIIDAEIFGLAGRLMAQNPLIFSPNNQPAAVEAARRILTQPIKPGSPVWYPRVLG